LTITRVIHFFAVFFLLVVEAVAFAAGFLAVGFLAATALALAGALAPVTAFFAAPRFDEGVVFFTGADFLPATVFFGAGAAFALVAADFVAEFFAAAAGFLVVTDLPVVVAFAFVAGFLAVVALAVAAFVVAALVAIFAGRDLVAGLGAAFAGLFSLEAEVSVTLAALGGSFTRPEGPLGRTKVPFSAPVVMALLK